MDERWNVEPPTHRYLAFYKGKTMEIAACTSYAAQQIAAKSFGVRPTKSYQVAVKIVEKDGKPVVHSTASL
jgi:hypothetical protein